MQAELNQINEAFVETPIGLLKLRAQNNFLIGITFATQQASHSSSNMNPFLEFVNSELLSYFAFANHKFSIPLLIQGTFFQKQVWDLLQAIPLSKTNTYGELAAKLNTSPRAIGNACRLNPLLIIIPCHRVTAKNHLGGFFGERKGDFLSKKSWLLKHEQVNNVG